MGAVNALDLARKLGAPLLQASTSEVYGDPEIHPQVEAYWGNVNPVGTRACYDEGKRCAESLCYDYARQFGVTAKVVRIFNTYGPRLNPGDGRVISNFIDAAIRGQPISVYGSGLQTRSFCFVSDLVRGLVSAMEHPGMFENPVNLGRAEEYSIIDLGRKIVALCGSSSPIIHVEAQADDPRRRCPDVSTAANLLGWRAMMSLDDGLRHTIDSFRIEDRRVVEELSSPRRAGGML